MCSGGSPTPRGRRTRSPPQTPGSRTRTPTCSHGWASSSEFDEAAVRSIPLFAELEPDALELVLGSAHELRVRAGETVIRRWQGTRHFYAVLSGELEVRTDAGVVRTISDGDFFGELAALDWGAGFGYARTASVVARSPARLLVLAPAAFGELIRKAPTVDRVTRAAARERLRNV